MNSIRQFFRPKSTAEKKTTVLDEYLSRLQRRTADYLNRKARRLTVPQLKVLLVCFCLLSGGLCCYIALKPIIYGNGPPHGTHKPYGAPAKTLPYRLKK